MKKLMTLCLVLISLGLSNCATDVLVSTGAAAETKKQEAEQATETKNQILKQAEENQKKAEERKKALEEQQ